MQLERELRYRECWGSDRHFLSDTAGLQFASGLGEFLENPNPHLLFWWQEKGKLLCFLKRNPCASFLIRYLKRDHLLALVGGLLWRNFWRIKSSMGKQLFSAPLSQLPRGPGEAKVEHSDIYLQAPDYTLGLSGLLHGSYFNKDLGLIPNFSSFLWAKYI